MSSSDVVSEPGRLVVCGLSVVLATAAMACGLGGAGGGPPSVVVSEQDTAWEGEEDGSSGDSRTVDAGADTALPAPTGAACESSADCAGDVCLATEKYSDGYCSQTSCNAGDCVGVDAICVEFQDGSSGCLDGCGSHGDCRNGYSCQEVGSAGRRACMPGEPPPPSSFEKSRSVLNVQCDPTEAGSTTDGTSYEFEFTLDEEANGFLMVPYVRTGNVKPYSLKTPDRTIDILAEYRHHNSRFMDFYSADELTGFGTYGKVAFDWPVGVPYAPKFQKYVHPGGTYRLTVAADEETPCLYVLENHPGTTLDLNFYVLGLKDDLSAKQAKNDADLQAAIDWMRHLYDKVGVDLGELRYYEVSSDVEMEYKRIRSREEAQRLTAYGKPPTGTLAGHLSVDVFLVKDLQISRSSQGSVLGMSAGIPGAAGLHGHARNGLIFQTSDLGSNNKHVGLIMAHEIGHYLGLRHTTEVVHDTSRGAQLEDTIGTTDPIEDTPVCANIYDKLTEGRHTACEDFENLMFPVAPPPLLSQDSRLTNGQGAAMKANPLITSK